MILSNRILYYFVNYSKRIIVIDKNLFQSLKGINVNSHRRKPVESGIS